MGGLVRGIEQRDGLELGCRLGETSCRHEGDRASVVTGWPSVEREDLGESRVRALEVRRRVPSVHGELLTCELRTAGVAICEGQRIAGGREFGRTSRRPFEMRDGCLGLAKGDQGTAEVVMGGP